MAFDNIIRVYNKNKELLAICDGETESKTPEAKQNMLVAPRVRRVLNDESTLTFQALADSDLWQSIKDPENLYHVNDRWYTALAASAYQYKAEKGVRVINASLVETWALLNRTYNQAYNCGVYCYARAKFRWDTIEGAVFEVKAEDCSNAGNTIPAAAAWEQIKAWSPTDEAGNLLSYAILSSDEYAPKNWEDVPVAVALKSVTIEDDTAFLEITPRTIKHITQTWDYSAGSYKLDSSLRIFPPELTSVRVNYTTTTDGEYNTQETEVSYNYTPSAGSFTISFDVPSGAVVNAVIAEYDYYDLGKLGSDATCTFAYGAEVVDEHTFVILPKANSKYKLTIDGVPYEDEQVKDARGVVMPRGSGGYAMWAALKNSGWSLGICDVIAKDFDPSIDYGCFNVESDMKDVLYNVQNIQSLYGGLLMWDSENQVLNYRAENSADYQAYDDGFNDWTGYDFRVGKNMTSLPEITYDNTIITRGYPLGYGGLNIKAVNDGKTYIDDFSYTDAVYEGYLEQPLIFDTNDDSGQKQLLYWGRRELAKRCRPQRSISLSVKDIRTTEGCEHEVFDLGDIVRVFYVDDQSGYERVETQRITVWEYSVFAMWDSLVELDNKTRNLVELFKLIYKSTQDAPSANASGKISSTDVRIDGASWSSLPYAPTLTEELEALSRTTTGNTDAIADLVVETNNLYAQVDLFAQYQKQTNELFTQTYAGLQLYADEKSASALLAAQMYTNSAVAGTASVAYVQAYVTEQMAQIDIIAQLNKEIGNRVETMQSFITVNAENGITLGSTYSLVTISPIKIRLSAMYGVKAGDSFEVSGHSTFDGDVTFKGDVFGVYAQFA